MNHDNELERASMGLALAAGLAAENAVLFFEHLARISKEIHQELALRQPEPPGPKG